MANHYNTLNLSPEASPEQVRESIEVIRKKMGTYAPGIIVTDELIQLNYPEEWGAFTILSDPASRTSYDALIKPSATIREHVEPVQTTSFLNSFLSYAAVVGLMGAIVLFLAFLGSYLI